MRRRILVAYASKHGSTREVAEAIAASLREQNFAVELRSAVDVADLDAYSGIVLGGALYMGRLHPDARRFLRRHRRLLAALPVAVFAMGPLTTEEKDVQGAWDQLQRALAKVTQVQPISTAIFGGVVDPSELRSPFNRMPASDARDWDLIEKWAREVGVALGARAVVASPT